MDRSSCEIPLLDLKSKELVDETKSMLSIIASKVSVINIALVNSPETPNLVRNIVTFVEKNADGLHLSFSQEKSRTESDTHIAPAEPATRTYLRKKSSKFVTESEEEEEIENLERESNPPEADDEEEIEKLLQDSQQ